MWVVVVTKWQCGTGEGWRPAATRPAMWAMSAMSSEPDSVGDLAKAREVDRPAVGRGAADDQLRPVLERQALDLVVVDALGRAIDAVGDDVEIAAGIGEADGRG